MPLSHSGLCRSGLCRSSSSSGGLLHTPPNLPLWRYRNWLLSLPAPAFPESSNILPIASGSLYFSGVLVSVMFVNWGGGGGQGPLRDGPLGKHSPYNCNQGPEARLSPLISHGDPGCSPRPRGHLPSFLPPMDPWPHLSEQCLEQEELHYFFQLQDFRWKPTNAHHRLTLNSWNVHIKTQ